MMEVTVTPGIDCPDCFDILAGSRYGGGMERFITKARAMMPFRVTVETVTGIHAQYKPTRLAAVRAYKRLSRDWPEGAKTVAWESNESDPWPILAWGAEYVEFASQRELPVCVL